MNFDGNLLNSIVAIFREALVGIGPQLREMMMPFLLILIRISFVLFLLARLFTPSVATIGALGQFVLGCGFMIFGVTYGEFYISSMFAGMSSLSVALGAPPLNPSAVAGFGIVASEAIHQSIADQGWLSNLFSLSTFVYQMAAFAVQFSFLLLAIELMGTLILSYVLAASAPFFLAWSGTQLTRGIALGYLRTCFGTMSLLFFFALIGATVQPLADLLGEHFRNSMLQPGFSLGWVDYLAPLFIGITLCSLWVYLPVKIARLVDAVALDWGGAIGGAVGGAVSSTTSSVDKAQQWAKEGSKESQKQVSSSQGSDWGGGGFGGSMGPAVSPSKSSWSK